MNSRDWQYILLFIAFLMLLYGLHATSPAHKFEECKGDSVPRYCVE